MEHFTLSRLPLQFLAGRLDRVGGVAGYGLRILIEDIVLDDIVDVPGLPDRYSGPVPLVGDRVVWKRDRVRMLAAARSWEA